MDKELIKKYKQEFEHWLTGGELLFMPEDRQTWFNTLRTEIDWSIKGTYVINDTYVQLRIALTEGKTIQIYGCIEQNVSNASLDIYGWKDFKSFKPHSIFSYDVENYRIKPEEPKFKVGDWVVNKTSKQRIVKKVASIPYGDSVTVGDTEVGINVMLINDLELWQPKAGEWCWFWSETLKTPMLLQFERFCSTDLYKYNANNGRNYQYCEPFLGKLPTTLKGM